jgi:hypothetical protein
VRAGASTGVAGEAEAVKDGVGVGLVDAQAVRIRIIPNNRDRFVNPRKNL